MKNNSNLLIEARRRLGFTQKQMAAALGVAANYVYMIESGRKPLTRPVREKLSELDRSTITSAGNDESASPVPGPDAPDPHVCRYPEGCALETELADMRAQMTKMAAQLETVTLLLGAALRVDDKQQPGRQAG